MNTEEAMKWYEEIEKKSQKESISLDKEKDLNQIAWLIKQARKVQLLEESLKIYKEENDQYEKSTHINNFLYELSVNDKNEIPCLIQANGVDHSFGITEKDAKSFVHVFQMQKMK